MFKYSSNFTRLQLYNFLSALFFICKMSGNTSIPKGLEPWYKICTEWPGTKNSRFQINSLVWSPTIWQYTRPSCLLGLSQPTAIDSGNFQMRSSVFLSSLYIHCLQKYDRPTTKSRCRIDALIMAVYHALDSQGFIHTPTRVKLDFDTLDWSPITYNNAPYS